MVHEVEARAVLACRPVVLTDADAEIAKFPLGVGGEGDIEIVNVERMFE